jgi:type II secretory pathway predicted ATPase ExeA
LEDGYKKLLAIVLIGQIELKAKLDESKNWEAREVIRRMELLKLEPLGSEEGIAGYLDIKFERLGKERRSIIDDTGCTALGAKLRRQTRKKNTGTSPRCLPAAHPVKSTRFYGLP